MKGLKQLSKQILICILIIALLPTARFEISAEAGESQSFEAANVSVVFKDWDGTVLKTENVVLGESATAPAVPFREGYTFKRWDKDFSKIQKDMIVTALYSADEMYQIIVNYIYRDTYGIAAKSHSELLTFGSSYKIKSPVIDGYKLENEEQAVIIGKITDKKELCRTIDVYYTQAKDTTYTVNHHKEKLDGGYELAESETIDAGIGNTLDVKTKNYHGFKMNQEKTGSLTVTVVADGKTTKDIYYSRKIVRIYFSTSGNYIEPIEGYYGEDISEKVSQTANPTRPGYTFKSWDIPIPTVLLEDLTITALWEESTAEYVVLYWKQNADDDDYTLEKAEAKSGNIGELCTYNTTIVNESSFAGFEFLKADQDVTIKSDGSTFLNVYYNRKMTGLSFYVDGVLYHEIRGRYGATIDYWPDSNDVFQLHKQNNPSTPNTYFLSWENRKTNYRPIGHFTQLPMPEAGEGDTYKLHALFSNLKAKKYTMHHFLEDLEGAGNYIYSEEHSFYQTVEINYRPGSHEGFTVCQYRLSSSISAATGVWKSLTPSGHFYYDSSLPYAELRFKRNSYNISYYSNGKIINQEKLLYESIIPLNDPEEIPEGYTFGGWYKDIHYAKKCKDTDTVQANDTILYAKWIPDVYEAAIVYNNGAPNGLAYVDRGEKLTVPEEPIRDGYHFDGWMKENGLPYEFDSPAYKDFTIIAKWIPRDNIEYSVIHKMADGTVLSTEKKTGTMGAYVYEQSLIPGDAKYPANEKIIADQANRSLKLSAQQDNNVIEFTYKTFEKVGYRVRYVLADEAESEGNLIDEQSFTTENVVMSVRAKEFDGYLPQFYYLTQTLSFNEEYNIFTFYYTKNGDGSYRVEHYLSDGKTGYNLDKTEYFSGAIGSSVTADPKSYSGYTYDKEASIETKTGIVTDPSTEQLVLKLYYKLDTTKEPDEEDDTDDNDNKGNNLGVDGEDGDKNADKDKNKDKDKDSNTEIATEDNKIDTSKNPVTGDLNNYLQVIIIMAVSVLTIILALGIKRKKQQWRQ